MYNELPRGASLCLDLSESIFDSLYLYVSGVFGVLKLWADARHLSWYLDIGLIENKFSLRSVLIPVSVLELKNLHPECAAENSNSRGLNNSAERRFHVGLGQASSCDASSLSMRSQ